MANGNKGRNSKSNRKDEEFDVADSKKIRRGHKNQHINNRFQPKKDNNSKRVNYDNTREGKFERDIRKTDNDVKWYMKNPEMFKAAGSIAFSGYTGQKLPFGRSYYNNAVPGIMTLTYAPNFGGGNIPALQQSADSVYSYTVHANSRNQSYRASDEMILILAGASAFSFISWILRLYGTMRQFNGFDAYTPKVLISAMGADYDDLKANLANMWFDINHMISRTKQIWIPNTMPVIERWFWLNANIYMDAESAKSQYYLFNPEYFLMLDETSFEQGGALVPVSLGNAIFSPSHPTSVQSTDASTGTQTVTTRGGYTWSEILQAAEAIFDALEASSDRGLIFGDILKAYGTEKLYAIPEVTADYKVQPVYNREVLSQIENATPTYHFAANMLMQDQKTDTLSVEQDWYHSFGTYYLSIPNNTRKTAQAYHLYGISTILNFHQLTQPTPEQIMVATRLTTTGMNVQTTKHWTYISGEWKQTQTNVYVPYSTGTEECVSLKIWCLDYPTTGGTPDAWGRDLYPGSLNGSDSPSVGIMQVYNAFDWAPFLYGSNQVSNTSASGDPDTFANNNIYCVGDYDNWAVVTYQDIYKLHITALNSEFGVPNVL